MVMPKKRFSAPLQSLREFPPRQKPASFSLDRVMEAVTKGAGDK
jgi:hypothetical protein